MHIPRPGKSLGHPTQLEPRLVIWIVGGAIELLWGLASWKFTVVVVVVLEGYHSNIYIYTLYSLLIYLYIYIYFV